MAWLSVGSSNDDLCDKMLGHGIPISTQILLAFRRTDRGDFVQPQDRLQAYHDRPYKKAHIHISAPHMYATVLEALDLHPGQSFLNVGSGSGYLCCLVACLLEAHGVIHGIEVSGAAAEHSRDCISTWLQKQQEGQYSPIRDISIVHGNCFDIDISSSASTCKYDRIYIGAGCPDSRKEFFYHLLAEGGVMVVPINEKNQMLKITKICGNIFKTDHVSNVYFAPLLDTEARPDELASQNHVSNPRLISVMNIDPRSLHVLSSPPPGGGWSSSSIHPSYNRRTKLPSLIWTPIKTRHNQFPEEFRKVVWLILLGSRRAYVPNRSNHSRPFVATTSSCWGMLPTDVWFEIISFCSRDWFVPSVEEVDTLRSELMVERRMRMTLEEKLRVAEAARRAAERERDLFRIVMMRMNNGNTSTDDTVRNLSFTLEEDEDEEEEDDEQAHDEEVEEQEEEQEVLEVAFEEENDYEQVADQTMIENGQSHVENRGLLAWALASLIPTTNGTQNMDQERSDSTRASVLQSNATANTNNHIPQSTVLGTSLNSHTTRDSSSVAESTMEIQQEDNDNYSKNDSKFPFLSAENSFSTDSSNRSSFVQESESEEETLFPLEQTVTNS